MLTVKEPTDWNAHHPAEGLEEGEGGDEGGEWGVVYFESIKINPFTVTVICCFQKGVFVATNCHNVLLCPFQRFLF